MKDFISLNQVRIYLSQFKNLSFETLSVMENHFLIGSEYKGNQAYRESSKAGLKAIEIIRKKRDSEPTVKLQDIEFVD